MTTVGDFIKEEAVKSIEQAAIRGYEIGYKAGQANTRRIRMSDEGEWLHDQFKEAYEDGYKAGQASRDELLRECWKFLNIYSNVVVTPVDVIELQYSLIEKLKESGYDQRD